MEAAHGDLDLIVIESGGDNITTTFSPALADYFIYVVDVAGDNKYPEEGRGSAARAATSWSSTRSDLAPYVGADLSVMERDARATRKAKPFVFTNCRTGEGIDAVVDRVVRDLLFEGRPRAEGRKA